MMNPTKRLIIKAVAQSDARNTIIAKCFCDALEIAENPDEMKEIFEEKMLSSGKNKRDIEQFYIAMNLVLIPLSNK